MKKLVIEVESNNGSTIGSVMIDVENLKVIEETNCSVADFDND